MLKFLDAKKESGIVMADPPAKIDIFELQSTIEALVENVALHQEKNFDMRREAIDFIGFHVVDQIYNLIRSPVQNDKLSLLKYKAEKIIYELEEIDKKIFQRLRANIRIGGYSVQDFRNMINEYVTDRANCNEYSEVTGYSNLDIFVNGLTYFQNIPDQTKNLEAEMVYYQKTPAGIVFEFVKKLCMGKEEVFFDIGSGLGQVAILVNLLTGVEARGVEYEPAFCEYARNCAKELNLSNVTFTNIDAREADYSDGTVFFMFTPFKGKILLAVLELLRKESLKKKIKIITYGPCTEEISLQSWLKCDVPNAGGICTLSIFASR